jgi:hypothetical protein
MQRPAGCLRCEKGNDDGLAVAANEWCKWALLQKSSQTKVCATKGARLPGFDRGQAEGGQYRCKMPP